MFYIKRKDEFYVLEALGVTSDRIKKILHLDALILSVAGSAAYLIVTPIGVNIIHNIANRYFSRLGGLRYESTLPLIPYAVGMAAIVVCAFISSSFAYRSYRRKEIAKYKINISTLNSEFGE